MTYIINESNKTQLRAEGIKIIKNNFYTDGISVVFLYIGGLGAIAENTVFLINT